MKRYSTIIIGILLMTLAPAVAGYLGQKIDIKNLGYFMSLFIGTMMIMGAGLALVMEVINGKKS